jgi:hypothetical protein
VKDPVLAKRAVAVVLTRIFRGTHTDFGDAIGLVIPEEWIWHEPLFAQVLGPRVQERPVGNSKADSHLERFSTRMTATPSLEFVRPKGVTVDYLLMSGLESH